MIRRAFCRMIKSKCIPVHFTETIATYFLRQFWNVANAEESITDRDRPVN